MKPKTPQNSYSVRKKFRGETVSRQISRCFTESEEDGTFGKQHAHLLISHFAFCIKPRNSLRSRDSASVQAAQPLFGPVVSKALHRVDLKTAHQPNSASPTITLTALPVRVGNGKSREALVAWGAQSRPQRSRREAKRLRCKLKRRAPPGEKF